MAEDIHTRDESEDFKRMRAYDREWTGPKFVMMLVVTLAIANAVIYGLASMGTG